MPGPLFSAAFAVLIAFALGAAAPFLRSARGAEVEGLYGAVVPVEGRAEAERAAALGRALLRVFAKVSGAREAGDYAGLAEAARNPGRFVERFSYATVPPDPVLGGEPGLRLEVSFDPATVDETLRAAGLAVWGRERPAVLAWVAVERQGSRELLGGEGAGGLGEVLDRTAAGRGIPLVMPLMDLEDRRRLAVTDVWGGFREVILQASRRYTADAVLVGRVYPATSVLWEGRWRLLLENASHDWSSSGEVVEVAVEEGLHGAADRLAAEFARVGGQGGPSGVELRVSGIGSIEDYARTLNYLQSLDLVDRVDVVRAEADSLALRLDARGGREALARVIALGRTLEPVGVGPGLSFRLAP